MLNACSSEQGKAPKNTIAADPSYTPKDATFENWKPPYRPDSLTLDSLRAKSAANRGRDADLSTLTNEQITHRATSLANLYCSCQSLPAKLQPATPTANKAEKPAPTPTKPMCLNAVQKSYQKTETALKDANKQQTFRAAYNKNIANCQ